MYCCAQNGTLVHKTGHSRALNGTLSNFVGQLLKLQQIFPKVKFRHYNHEINVHYNHEINVLNIFSHPRPCETFTWLFLSMPNQLNLIFRVKSNISIIMCNNLFRAENYQAYKSFKFMWIFFRDFLKKCISIFVFFHISKPVDW